jgi:hypothetical protein
MEQLSPTSWPTEPHPVGKSLCHWFPPASIEPFNHVIRALPENPTYVEFGTFLGAGTTLKALRLRDDLQALCLDHWGITGTSAARWNPRGAKNGRHLCDFMVGKGTALQHCQNNLWAYRDRVKLFKGSTTHRTVDILANQGIQPDCVLLDDDHSYEGFMPRLFRCRYRWPNAVIICDDHTSSWPGVVKGVKEALARGFYTKEELYQVGPRMVAFKRDKTDG